jgi:hypothetical protein
VSDGAAILAREIARAVEVLKMAGVPMPLGERPLEIALAARAWEYAQIRPNGHVRCAADILEAAADCSTGDPLVRGFALGQRVAGMEWAFGGIVGQLAAARHQVRATEDGRKKAGDGMKRAGRDSAMKLYGHRALELACQIVEDGKRKSVEAVINGVRDQWRKDGLPETNRAIRNLIGVEISAMLRPRLPGRRKRVA